MKQLVSVIVPVYNIDFFLPECIESILKQTYTQIELILVDDGSTDKSGEICEYYKKKDSRIIVLHKQNGGLSDARNAGIDIAKGNYITFIDGDDTIERNYIDYLVSLLQKYNVDIAACREYRDVKHLIEASTLFLSFEEIMKYILTDKIVTPSAWGKMYSIALFKDIRYPKGMLFEDFATIYKLLYKSGSIVQSNKELYFYRPNPTGIMLSPFNKKCLDIIKVHNEAIEFMEHVLPDYVCLVKARKVRHCLFMLVKCIKSAGDNSKYELLFRNEINGNYKCFLNSDFAIKEKLACILQYISYNLFRRIIIWRNAIEKGRKRNK